jgi:hypothetical protein
MAGETKKDGLTRAQAETLIARATTTAELDDDKVSKHPNKHVQKKRETKLGKLSA